MTPVVLSIIYSDFPVHYLENNCRNVCRDRLSPLISPKKEPRKLYTFGALYLARPAEVESTTFWSVVRRSIQLSYGRMCFMKSGFNSELHFSPHAVPCQWLPASFRKKSGIFAGSDRLLNQGPSRLDGMFMFCLSMSTDYVVSLSQIPEERYDSC